jgi:hypothetical protein
MHFLSSPHPSSPRIRVVSLVLFLYHVQVCPPPPTAAKDGFSPKAGSAHSGRWMWMGHTVYLGWRVAAQLAATDIDDLKVPSPI